MDEAANIALKRVWTLVAGVLCALRALPGMGGVCLPGPLWRRAFAELRFAEAAARRALFVMAAATPRADPPAPSAMPPEREPAPGLSPNLSPKSARNPAFRAHSTGAQPRSGQVPVGRSGRPRGGLGAADNSRERKPTSSQPFRLSDTLPDPLALAGLIEATGPAGPIVSTGTPRPIAGLKARMAALAAVLADPGPALSRFLRRRDRPRRHIFDRGNAPRLKPGYPPGFRPVRALEWDMDVLMEIHTLAWHGGRPSPLVPDAPDACPVA